MKKLVLLLLFSTISIIASTGDSKTSECLTPTEYILHFLKKSGTSWRGASDWKDVLENGKTVHTNYMSIRDGTLFEYTGFAIAGHDFYTKFGSVPVDTLKATFEISREEACKGDRITIKSHIEDTEVRRNISDQEVEELQKKAKKCAKKSDTDTDFCSECVRTCKIDLDKKTRTLRATLVSDCISSIPVKFFMKNINKVD